MRVYISIIAVCLCLTVSKAQQPGHSTISSVPALETFVSKWIDLRLQIAEEKQAWKEQETYWNMEIDLLKKENVALEKEISEATENEASVQDGRAELLACKERTDQALEQFPPLLDRAEAEIRDWQKLIPPPLATPFKEAFRQIPATYEEARKLSVSRRLQLIVALYTQIETLQRKIHVTKEVLSTKSGSKKEMDVLYLGLARGFAVSQNNEWAAVSTPGPEGWQWKPQPGIAGQVRRAIQMFNREQTAEFIDLPLQREELD